MTKQCNVCGDKFDEEFISDYESDKDAINVCEYCTDNNKYDPKKEMNYIVIDGVKYYDRSYRL